MLLVAASGAAALSAAALAALGSSTTTGSSATETTSAGASGEQALEKFARLLGFLFGCSFLDGPEIAGVYDHESCTFSLGLPSTLKQGNLRHDCLKCRPAVSDGGPYLVSFLRADLKRDLWKYGL